MTSEEADKPTYLHGRTPSGGEVPPSEKGFNQIRGGRKGPGRSSRHLKEAFHSVEKEELRIKVLKAVSGFPIDEHVKGEVVDLVTPWIGKFERDYGMGTNQAITFLIFQYLMHAGYFTPQLVSKYFARSGLKVKASDLWRALQRVNPEDRAVFRPKLEDAAKRYLPSNFPITRDLWEHAGLQYMSALTNSYLEKFRAKLKKEEGRRPSTLAREALLEADRDEFEKFEEDGRWEVLRDYVDHEISPKLKPTDLNYVGRKGLVVPSELPPLRGVETDSSPNV